MCVGSCRDLLKAGCVAAVQLRHLPILQTCSQTLFHSSLTVSVMGDYGQNCLIRQRENETLIASGGRIMTLYFKTEFGQFWIELKTV